MCGDLLPRQFSTLAQTLALQNKHCFALFCSFVNILLQVRSSRAENLKSNEPSQFSPCLLDIESLTGETENAERHLPWAT